MKRYLEIRVVNGPISSGPNPKANLKPKSSPKKPKVKLDLKNLVMLPSYFDYISAHLSQKARLRPKIFVNFRPEPVPKMPARLTTLFLNVKDLVLSNYFKMREMWSNGIEKAIFFKNLQKVAKPPAARSVIRLSYTRLLTMFPNLDILTFQHLLQTLPFQQNPSCVPNQATASDLPFYDIFVP